MHGEQKIKPYPIWVPLLLPPSISVSIGSIPKIFGVGLVQHWKEIFFVSEISADPQKCPYGVRGGSRRAKNGQKHFVKFDTKLLKNRNRAKKIRTRVSGDFLGPKVTTPQIWGSAEVSAVLGVFLKICSCQLFFKKNFSHFLLLFFPIFFQKWSKSKGQ